MVLDKCKRCGKRLNTIIIVVCLALTVFKFFVGYIGNSHALMAAAFYSLQYVIVAVMVSWGIGFTLRSPTEKHPFGFGKLEYVVTSAISIFIIASMLIMLFVVGTRFLMGPSKPTMLAVWGAVISLLTTHLLAGYLKCIGKHLKSPAIVSNAKHLHMDSISAICLIAAIILTMNGMRHLDSIVAIAEAVHIIFTSTELFTHGIKGLMDSSLPDREIAKIRKAMLSVPGVRGINTLRTREMGQENHVDCEIQTEGAVTIEAAESVKKQIRASVGRVLNTPITMNISVIPIEMAMSHEKWMTARIAKVLCRYYSKFIESHRIVLGVQEIGLELGFLPVLSAFSCNTLLCRITGDLKREIPGTRITVTIRQDNHLNKVEVAHV
jgi:cation diffusion facilitator family transporter